MPVTALKPVTFRSKHSALRLVRKSIEEVMNPATGNMTRVAPEVVYEFKDGVLEVLPGQDVLPDKRFDLDTQSWESQDALEYLRTHDLFNLRFIEVEAIPTDPSVIYEAITDAMIAGDLERLQAIGDEEFASFNRAQIMGRITAAMDTLEARAAEDVVLDAPAKPPAKKE